MKLWLGLFLLTICFANAQEYGSIQLPFQQDLIPEGIAIDAKTEKIYLNSLKHGKIVRCNLDGSDPETFIDSNEHGYLPGFGMTIVSDTFYALGNILPKEGNKSILIILDVQTGNLYEKYTIENDSFIYLNDLAVDAKGKVYITDSESNSLYTINRDSNELEVFFANDEIQHSNGIAISPDGKFLYLATYTSGIRILDIESKKLLNRPNEHKGIDGLKYYEGKLYAIVNGRREASKNGVFKFGLNQNGSEIRTTEKIWEFEHPTDIPTTFAIYGGSMYFVSDSQLRNFDQESNEIIEPDKLKNYQLVQLKL